MKRIGLLSDTHSFLDLPLVRDFFKDCDEIWHAGDFGNIAVYDQLLQLKPTKGVWGNIDGNDVRQVLPKINIFHCEQVKVLMIHIGGYPHKYPQSVRNLIATHQPNLFICGHSHILKIMYDAQYQMLTMNPGAFGKEGFHKVRTLVRFSISEDKIHDLQIFETKR
ncbi:MAG: metallophosphoesterase family protein [Chitinophagales bacterium]|nr:metallophosphoesterase family protein [Bacteroidota bacterium]MCB9042581.1 metallophosphoesterase family protein [Chitinophagales bacterium]